MGFFSTIFGWDAAEIESVKNEINIMDAICRDDQCELGKWIHGPALKHFHGDEYLNILREHHAKFHVLAASIVERIQANDKAAAEKILFGDYNETSHIVKRDLTELGKHLAIDKL